MVVLGIFFLLNLLYPCNICNLYYQMYINVTPNRTYTLLCCSVFWNDQLHTMESYITCTTTVLCCTGSFYLFADTLFVQKSICYGIITGFVVISLFVFGISVCLSIYFYDAYNMLREIDIISNSVS